MIHLESDRLLMEPIGVKHCTPRYLHWLNDSEVYKFLETRGGQTMEMLENFIRKQIENKVFMWAIIKKEDGKHIGNIKIDPVNEIEGSAEYGILMGDKEEWGKGFAQEASLCVINYFFNREKSLKRINLGVIEDNKAAIHLYKKIGFEIEELQVNSICRNGVLFNTLRMSKVNRNG